MLFRSKSANQTALTPPWNKGKLVGQKPPLHPKHIWAIRTQLQMANKSRDLALFNLAIDSKLRGCDLVALKVEDIAPNGYAMDRGIVRQRKTGRSVKFEITEQTRQSIDQYLNKSKKQSCNYLFGGRPRASVLSRQFDHVRHKSFFIRTAPWSVSLCRSMLAEDDANTTFRYIHLAK